MSVLRAIFAIVPVDDYDQRVAAFAKPSMALAIIGGGKVIWRLMAYIITAKRTINRRDARSIASRTLLDRKFGMQRKRLAEFGSVIFINYRRGRSNKKRDKSVQSSSNYGTGIFYFFFRFQLEWADSLYIHLAAPTKLSIH